MIIKDNNKKIYTPIIKNENNIYNIIIKKEDVMNFCEYIEFEIEDFCANKDDEGFYLISDVDKMGSYLIKFTEKKDEEHILRQALMPMFCVKKKDFSAVVIAKGMKYNMYLRVGVKDNKYYLYTRFVLENNLPYEDINLEIHLLDKNASLCDIAKEYRNYQLENKKCLPIKDRMKNNPELKYATESIELRIRMGWKEAPPKILEQTIENEPEMNVACTFKRVMDVIDELERQCVKKVEICLVGWNKSGHDGRWPDAFPVEEKLGGEEKLRELIKYAQEKGYQITCHTNSTDCYSIAKDFSYDMVAKNKDGSNSVNEVAWSGGRMYNICPHFAYKYAKDILPKVAELGFKGLHYIDVISVIYPRRCYDKNHLATEKDFVDIYDKIMEMSHNEFGGFSSEGAFDFTSKYLDYALYVTFGENESKLFDEEVPLFQLVYNGIIMSNPSTSTVNYIIQDDKAKSKMKKFNGRPAFYLYSHFLTGTNWMGKDDLKCDTDEELKYAVSKLKEAYDDYSERCHLQLEFIDEYKSDNDKYTIKYSDGTIVKGE